MSFGVLRILLASYRPVLAVLAGAGVLLACTQEVSAPKKGDPQDPGNDGFYAGDVLPDDPLPETVIADSGAFAPPERPAGPKRPPRPDGGYPLPDAGPKVDCPALAAGDLAVVELMIASKSGSNDSGEWVEIRNMRSCWVQVKGVTVESPRGSAASNTVTITDALELPPGGTFIVADSTDATKNGGLPGAVYSWAALDVLKNDTDSITVRKGTLQIDKVTYPSLTNVTPGRSIAFPDDCMGQDRTDWNRWSLSFDEYGPGLKGTPNEPNGDIACF